MGVSLGAQTIQKMKGFIILGAVVVINVCYYNLINNLENEKALQKMKYELVLKEVMSKYKWKTDRLKTYCDLIYNTKNGLLHENK